MRGVAFERDSGTGGVASGIGDSEPPRSIVGPLTPKSGAGRPERPGLANGAAEFRLSDIRYESETRLDANGNPVVF